MADSVPHYDINLEEDPSAQRREKRQFKVNVLILPLIRLVGFTFLLTLVWLLNLKQLNSNLSSQLLAFSLIVYGYCLGVWLLLYLLYRKWPGRSWQEVFFASDLTLSTLVVYFTGGNTSLLFFLYLSRPAMQLATISPRAAFFNLISPLFYLGLLVYLSQIERRFIDYPLETIKIIILFVFGFYLTLVARQVENIRQRMGFYYQTARDALREKLIGAETTYHDLLNRIPNIIFRCDPEGRITYYNRTAASLLGYTYPTETNGLKLYPDFLFDPTPLKEIRKEIEEFGYSSDRVVPIKKKDGTMIWVAATIYPLRNSTGEIINYEGILQDITALKKGEEELLAKTRINAMLLDSLPCLAMLLKTDSREIILSNKVGQNAGGAPSKHCFNTFSNRESPCPWCLAPEAWTSGKTQHKEIETSQGQVWDLYWIPLGADQYIHYGFDITEQKRLEKQLIQVQKMEAIGQLAGGIAHDFNNILTGITGYTSLMKMKMSEDNPFFPGISIIEKSAWRAAELTRQLLGFARGGKYEAKQIDLNAVVNNVLGIIRETFDRAITINTSLRQEVWPVEGDPGQLEQVLLNICLNARDAMPVGGRLSLETGNICLDEAFARTHLGAAMGEYVMLTISDTGTGIPPEIQGKIFEPFFTTKEIGKGTGMGLAMAYGIIKNHGGYISVYSELGRGSCFKIYLPAIKKMLPKKTSPSSDVIPAGSGTILLVDDEEIVRELGKTILENLGYQVILARDGKEACLIFSERNRQINLVLLDMIMPEMGGKETFLELKKINNHIKVLFCSGYTIDGQALNILHEGAQGFVQKPFNLQQLAQSVSEALTLNY